MSGQYYSFNSIIQYYLHKLGILQKHFLGQSIIASQRMQAVNYSASLRIFYASGTQDAGVANLARFGKKSVVFFACCLMLFILIFSFAG